MANLVGRRDTSTARSGRIIENLFPTIILSESDLTEAAFLSFYTRVTTQDTSTATFKWDTDEFLARTDTTSSTATSTATTIPVTTALLYIPNQIWIVKRTGEYIRIRSANTSTGNITVDRAVAGTAASIVSGDTLIRLAAAVGENSLRQVSQSTTPTEVYNYCQMFRKDFSMSARQVKTQFENGDDLPFQKMKEAKEFKLDISSSFLAGERASFTTEEGPGNTTRGLLNVPESYTWAVGGTMNEYALDEFLTEEGFRKGSRSKVLFSSTKVMLAFSQIAKDRLVYHDINLGSKSKPIGMIVAEYKAPNGGNLMLVEDRFLSDSYNGQAVGVDMDQLKRRVFSRNGISGDVKVIDNTQDVDDMGMAFTMEADMGLQWGLENTHFKITGVTGGAKGLSIV
jgi:hypothetical protein